MRHLVPCVVNIAKLFYEYKGSTKAKTILDLFSRLMDFYMSIGIPDFKTDVVSEIIQDFCMLYKSLVVSKDNNKVWFMKPKLHLLQELTFQMLTSGDPTHYWTYKDEDYMGLIASLGNSKGGPRSPVTLPENVFLRLSGL